MVRAIVDAFDDGVDRAFQLVMQTSLDQPSQDRLAGLVAVKRESADVGLAFCLARRLMNRFDDVASGADTRRVWHNSFPSMRRQFAPAQPLCGEGPDGRAAIFAMQMEIDAWMTAPAKEALTLQRPCQTMRFTSWRAREIGWPIDSRSAGDAIAGAPQAAVLRSDERFCLLRPLGRTDFAVLVRSRQRLQLDPRPVETKRCLCEDVAAMAAFPAAIAGIEMSASAEDDWDLPLAPRLVVGWCDMKSARRLVDRLAAIKLVPSLPVAQTLLKASSGPPP